MLLGLLVFWKLLGGTPPYIKVSDNAGRSSFCVL